MGFPPKKFAGQLSLFGNMANSDSERIRFGSAEIHEWAKFALPKILIAYQDREGTIDKRAKARQKGLLVLEIATGANWAETTEKNLAGGSCHSSGKEERVDGGVSNPTKT